MNTYEYGILLHSAQRTHHTPDPKNYYIRRKNRKHRCWEKEYNFVMYLIFTFLIFSLNGVRGFFIDIKSFRSHYGPGVDSASNRNEYQEHFLGVNTAGA